jgi:hypothetical protein
LDRNTMRHAIDRALAQIVWRRTPGARARQPWSKEPYATHEGVLDIPGLGSIRCYQLNTGQRVFRAEDLEALLGIEGDVDV